jgi:hypothetical protein
MSSHRFIELDSTYRDRNRFPLPSQFEVQISQSGIKDANNAVDPVSLASPIKWWQSNVFNFVGPSATISGTIITSFGIPPAIGAAGSQNVVYVQFTTAVNNPQITENYYSFAMLTTSNPSPVQQRRILSSKYMYTSGGNIIIQFILETPFTDAVVDGNTVIINDPTDLTDTSNPWFFVPNGRIGENAYANYYLYNESLTPPEYRRIEHYDSFTHLLTLDTTTSVAPTVSSGPISGWFPTNSYCIRKELPIYTGAIAVGPPLSNNILNINSNASNVDNIYKNQYIRFTSGTNDNEIRRITNYVGTTRTITVYPELLSVPSVGDRIELLAFSYDNSTPFVYSGSMVSQQEEVCYQIELIDLVLPNRTLDSGYGARTSFYPYFYVNLSNVSAPGSGNINIIYSNNPNSNRMLFRAAVDDVPNLITSSFIKIDGDGAVQTVKFKPNDNLLFEVRLPNGELFKTTLEETYSPYIPNSENQISAYFSIKRL